MLEITEASNARSSAAVSRRVPSIVRWSSVSGSGFLDAVKDQKLGALREFQHGVPAVESEPLDGPVERAQHEDAKGYDFDVGQDFAGAARVEKEPRFVRNGHSEGLKRPYRTVRPLWAVSTL